MILLECCKFFVKEETFTDGMETCHEPWWNAPSTSSMFSQLNNSSRPKCSLTFSTGFRVCVICIARKFSHCWTTAGSWKQKTDRPPVRFRASARYTTKDKRLLKNIPFQTQYYTWQRKFHKSRNISPLLLRSPRSCHLSPSNRIAKQTDVWALFNIQ